LLSIPFSFTLFSISQKGILYLLHSVLSNKFEALVTSMTLLKIGWRSAHPSRAFICMYIQIAKRGMQVVRDIFRWLCIIVLARLPFREIGCTRAAKRRERTPCDFDAFKRIVMKRCTSRVTRRSSVIARMSAFCPLSSGNCSSAP